MAPIWVRGIAGKERLRATGVPKHGITFNGIASTTSTIPRRPFRLFWAVPKGTPKEDMLELVVNTIVEYLSLIEK